MRALICGISGQDGAYLARLLLDNGYEVFGTSRDAQIGGFANLVRLGIRDRVRLESMAANDFRSVTTFGAVSNPTRSTIWRSSSVGLSFDQPVETLESIAVGTMNLLDAMRFLDRPIRFYNAGSSECFGDTEAARQMSDPLPSPQPLCRAKSAAHWLVANYREAYGLFACTGILFNHESPLRPVRFVTQKIVAAAVRSPEASARVLPGQSGHQTRLGMGAGICRCDVADVAAVHRLDFVIATGESHTLEEFAETAFGQVGLDWREHTDLSEALRRPSDLAEGSAMLPGHGKSSAGRLPTG